MRDYQQPSITSLLMIRVLSTIMQPAAMFKKCTQYAVPGSHWFPLISIQHENLSTMCSVSLRTEVFKFILLVKSTFILHYEEPNSPPEQQCRCVMLQTSSCRVMVVCRCSNMASSSEIFSWRVFSEEDDLLLLLLTSVWILVIWDWREDGER